MSQTYTITIAGTDALSSSRTDLNNTHDALLTNFSGTTDPSSGVPLTGKALYFWADTSNNLLKLRNAGNTAFGEICDLSDDTNNYGIVRADGSTTMSGGLDMTGGSGGHIIDLGNGTTNSRIDFDDDGDTSIRASADDTLDIEIGGSDVIQITSTIIDTAHEIRAGADVGGAASHVSMTNTVSTTVTGTTCTLAGDDVPTSGAQAGWLKFYNGTTIAYVAYWT